jgi:tryptophan synthase alpha chain
VSVRANPVAGARLLEQAIRDGRRPALAPFLTAGFPSPSDLPRLLEALGPVSDVIEVGVPFSDPLADGVTIRRASQKALEAGVTVSFVLDVLRARAAGGPPVALMSYLNPLLAFGGARFAREAAASGVSGVIVPDLPLEESGPFGRALADAGVALVQLVTPVTPAARLERLAGASRGFVYAVTTTGTTGGSAPGGAAMLAYLDRVRAASPLPVLAGFGIRTAAQLRHIAAHADGAIVGSALIEALERGEDPVAFLRGLRGAGGP